MNITISAIDGLKEAVLASGIKELLQGMDDGICVSIEKREALPQSAPAAPAMPVEAPKRRGRKPRAKAAPAPVKRAPAAYATSGGASGTGTIRDAVRAAIGNGADIETVTQQVQRTFPDKTRNYVGIVLMQLSKGGECELGDDGKWRKRR